MDPLAPVRPVPCMAPESRQEFTRQPHAQASKQETCILVPGEGLEPSLCCQNWILSPARLPIPPSRPDSLESERAPSATLRCPRHVESALSRKCTTASNPHGEKRWGNGRIVFPISISSC